VIGQIVGQIRADDDEGLVPTPNPLQNFRYLLRTGLANDQRQQGEAAQQRLQEWQMHFERVL
jgi:hypothetical protein